MSSDSAALQALARIEAGQDHIRTDLGNLKQDQNRLRETAARIEKETTQGFGEVNASLATVSERLEGHMRDDDRRFSDVQEDVTRAHRKIGGTTSYGGEAVSGVHHPEHMSGPRKAGIIGGILAGLSALGTWLAAHLGGGGS